MKGRRCSSENTLQRELNAELLSCTNPGSRLKICELSVSLRRHDREVKKGWGRGRLPCACLQVISGWFHSDEKPVPFEMFAGRGRPASRKDLIQQLEISDLIRLHQNPVGKGATTGAANLIRQQLDRAVEDSVIVRLKNAISAVIEEPNHAPVFDGPPEQRTSALTRSYPLVLR